MVTKEKTNFKRAVERQIVPKLERGLAGTGRDGRASGTLPAEQISVQSLSLWNVYVLKKSKSHP